VIDSLPELAAHRDSAVLVYHGLIDHDAPRVCYEYLRGLGRVARLDLVLATNGGNPTAARRLAVLLHEFTDRLTVLVPHRARSAGTLLCLGAHDLVLGPLAELSPLDPQLSASDGSRGGGEPTVLSAEDVRAFGALAHDWFAVPEADRLQVFALIAQRVFPGTLGSFYRADRLVRQLGTELLAYQLPDADPADRAAIVDRLVDGYHAHDYAITRGQARELGLRVTDPDPREEELLWAVVSDCGDQLTPQRPGERVLALFAATDPGAGPGVGSGAGSGADPGVGRGVDHVARRIEYASGPDRGPAVRWQVG
jgi:hypothetical protein